MKVPGWGILLLLGLFVWVQIIIYARKHDRESRRPTNEPTEENDQ